MKKISSIINKGIVLLIILSATFPGCKCYHKQDDSKIKNNVVASNDSSLYPKIVYLLPSPSEILFATFTDDIVFKTDLVAPSDIDKKAIKYDQQALILGVYLADLSYNVLSEKHISGDNIILSIKNLAQNLGIGLLLYDEYFHRIENNIGNVDSIDAIYNDFTQNSFSTLEESGNYELLSLVAMGAGIETMYLSYKSVDFGVINGKILPNFVGQRYIYENYYKNFLSYNKDKPDLQPLVKDVGSIYNLFQHYVVVVNGSSVVDKKDAHFAIKDRSSVKYYDKGIRALGDSIVVVRNNLIDLKYQ